ncbi:carbon-nitrogen hydrolase family protein [Nocardioides marmoribigeumensis]|uniref:Amidohydrolase n=1 Tax=Nocardioides marmoribigeumensis TaxID=433649 RepID=A0ABU2BU97_9ACTN|nr:carbon-nitrogen hydrolase family protein [Nocardioides marmoribigeumensis]MDR7362198.1 putative amidohydrolase [Nocardioides marmoribigeumensis]
MDAHATRHPGHPGHPDSVPEGPDPVRVALVQAAASRDPADNRRHLGSVDVAPADLVVWPEVTQRDLGGPGDDLRPDAEALDGPFVTALVERAGSHGGVWVAGMLERTGEPGGPPYNTLVVVDGGGVLASYRKLHLYDSFGYQESDRVRAGDGEPVVVDVAGLRVGLMTCYDLRFPEMARALSARGTDLLVCPAAWVAGPRKVRHWQTLVAARAVENVAYVAAVGQPGPTYSGHSLLVDPWGDVVVAVEDGEQVVVGEVSRALVAEARTENPSLLNRRDELVLPRP